MTEYIATFTESGNFRRCVVVSHISSACQILLVPADEPDPFSNREVPEIGGATLRVEMAALSACSSSKRRTSTVEEFRRRIPSR